MTAGSVTNSVENCQPLNKERKRRTGKLKIKCWKTVGHGPLALPSAIQRSCNPYFMQLSNELGRTRMAEVFDLLNLGRRTGIKLPAEKSPAALAGAPTT